MMIRLLIVAACIAGCAAQDSIFLNTCSSDQAAFQQWELNQGPAKNLITLVSTGYCIDVKDYATADESPIWAYECHTSDTNPAHQNQEFQVKFNESSVGTIVEIMTGQCIDRSAYGTTPGTVIWMYHCTGAYNQEWFYNTTDKTLRAPDAPDMCMQAGGYIPPPPRVCDKEPLASMDLCNPALPPSQRVASIVNNLTLSEKVGLFVNGASSVPRVNFPAYQWWSEALHGVGGSPGVSFQPPTPNATSFPQVVLTSATFNRSLWHEIGQTISTEARAMNNVGNAGLSFWTPNINIIRDPRWGRGQETPGEDPYVNAEYAAHFVPGLQEGEDPNHLKVSSCCKHFYAYNLENWNGVDRHHFDAIITPQDEADTWLPAWQSCVERGHVSSLMCSYNAVNGVPSCANGRIMTELARNAWGFQGYITSDCGAVADVIYAHQYTNTTDDTCYEVFNAGMDIDCGSFLTSYLEQAVTDNAVSEELMDERLTNLFMVQLRLGMFDPVDTQPYLTYNYTDKLDTPAHQELALRVAQEGIVLLKNDGTLPFNAANFKTIAIVGPNAYATGTLQGNYQGTAPYLISAVEGIQSYAPSSVFAHGCDIASNDTSGYAAASQAASTSDATVIVVGIDQSQESEGNDRYITDLPGVQNDFITTITAASKGPVVVVVMAGGSVDMSAAKDNAKVSSILWVGYPGQSGGQAIADVIFGTVNPSGRMPYTVYTKNLPNEVSMFDMGMRPNGTSNPGRTYRFYTNPTVYNFGDGLSYTTFSYTQSSGVIRASYDVINKHVAMLGETQFMQPQPSHKFYSLVGDATITVTNNGSVAGAVSVLAFMVPPNAGQNGVPLKFLFGFEKVYLAPGDSQTLTFPVTAFDLTVVDESGSRKAVQGEWKVSINQGQTEVPVSVA